MLYAVRTIIVYALDIYDQAWDVAAVSLFNIEAASSSRPWIYRLNHTPVAAKAASTMWMPWSYGA